MCERNCDASNKNNRYIGCNVIKIIDYTPGYIHYSTVKKFLIFDFDPRDGEKLHHL